jgi:4a-hydroxytetrahydrobiopterin dehydratase
MAELELARKHCVPCEGGVSRLSGGPLHQLLSQLDGWRAAEEHHLEKAFVFPDFKSALAFVDRVGDIAEREGHHPDIRLSWGRVEIEIWTHAVGGLTENDFVLAAKIDASLARGDARPFQQSVS